MIGLIARRSLIAATLGSAWFSSVPAAHGQDAQAGAAAEDAARAARAARLAERDRLRDQAQRHRDAGDHAAAIAAARQMVALEISLFGAGDSQVATTFGWIGDEQLAAGDDDAAAASYDKRVDILAALDDAQPWILVDARQAAQDARLRAGLDADARRKLTEAESLNCQSLAEYEAGDFQAAVVLAEQILLLRREVLGEEHPDTATSLSDLTCLYELSGEYARALPLGEQALAICQKVLGSEHPDTATALNNLGSLHQSMGASARAQALYEQALAIRKSALGDRHPDTGISLKNLAGLHRSLGHYDRAIPLYEQALAIDKKSLGDQHPDAAKSMSSLASLYGEVGKYERALSLSEQALAIIKKALGDEHADTATAMNNLGYLYRSMGDNARALPLYEQALAIRRRLLGNEHPVTASSLNNLASLYSAMGDNDHARPLLEQAVAIDKEVLGDEHPDTATLMNNLADLYRSVGEQARALPLYEQALFIRQKVLGDQHPDTAESLSNLSGFYASTGDYSRALPLAEQAFAITKKVLGNEHPDTTIRLNNLASLYETTGESARALSLFEQVLAVRRQALGDAHPATVVALNNLALAYAAVGESARARELLLAGAAAERGSLERQLLSFGDERIRSLLSTRAPSVDLLVSLPQANPRQADEALEVLLGSKAIAFEVLSRRRAAAYLADTDPEAAAVRRELVVAQRQLESLALRPPKDAPPEQLAARRTELNDVIRAKDEELSRKLATSLGAGAPLAVTASALRAALASGAAHVEYFRYFPFHYQATGDEPRWGTARYAAFVVTAEPPARLIDLGPAAEIEKILDELAAHVANFKRVAAISDETQLEQEYKTIASQLAARLFAPLRPALGAARRITLAPDGRLNEVAFEALAGDDGRFLLENGYEFAYVSSGRDLLRPHGELGAGVAVFAAPDYALGYKDRLALAAQALQRDATDAERPTLALAAGDAPSRSVDTRVGWRDLGEAALLEGQEAAEAFAGAKLGPVVSYTRGQALEELVKRLASPRVLVLITHGDYLENLPESAPALAGGRSFVEAAGDRGGAGLARSGLRAVQDPMLRSYLVLAGANQIDEQIPGDVQIENGWLTAQEIAQLDLRGTDLVVLSACSSNRGQASNGEAVAGMRSALLFAGARTIVGSLYEVPNAETRELLRSFYGGVAAGRGKLAALNAAKTAFIERRRERDGAAHPFYWASFILVGAP